MTHRLAHTVLSSPKRGALSMLEPQKWHTEFRVQALDTRFPMCPPKCSHCPPAHCREAWPFVHTSHTRHALLLLTHAHPRGTPQFKGRRTNYRCSERSDERSDCERCGQVLFSSPSHPFSAYVTLPILPRYHRHFCLLSHKPAMTPAVRRPIQTLTVRGPTFFSFSLTPIFSICHTPFVLYITDIFFQCEGRRTEVGLS